MDKKFQEGSYVFGHWKIQEELRSGQFGDLFALLYEDHGKEYHALLKVVSVPRNLKDLMVMQDNVEDFTAYVDSVLSFVLEEVSLMAELGGNPHVVSYFDHILEPHPNGIGYDVLIRTERLTSLEEYASAHCLSKGNVLQLGIDICKALEECHKKSIFHRDINPDHIYVTDSGTFKLGDFGLPCVESNDIPSLESERNQDFMAPELLKGENYDHTVDIYSLALLIHRLLNRGVPAFYPDDHSANWIEMEEAQFRRMAGATLPPPYYAKKGKLSKILAKACHHDPNMRYQSAQELRLELENLKTKKDDFLGVYPEEIQAETPPKKYSPGKLSSWFCW